MASLASIRREYITVHGMLAIQSPFGNALLTVSRDNGSAARQTLDTMNQNYTAGAYSLMNEHDVVLYEGSIVAIDSTELS